MKTSKRSLKHFWGIVKNDENGWALINYLIVVIKDTLKAFDDFKNELQRCMK